MPLIPLVIFADLFLLHNSLFLIPGIYIIVPRCSQVLTYPSAWLVQGCGDGLLTGKPWIPHGCSSLSSPLWDICGLVAVGCKTLVVYGLPGYLVRCF